mmetsp:Transcript_2397/g.5048  ORF Transcript_2397/g.5048 Transcript_2397/m.5048 type:complete len:89 (-) Transcript_2397:1203-1469(-)
MFSKCHETRRKPFQPNGDHRMEVERCQSLSDSSKQATVLASSTRPCSKPDTAALFSGAPQLVTPRVLDLSHQQQAPHQPIWPAATQLQ